MSIAYPLNTPTNIGIANIAFTAENAVAISQSPFTYAQQVVSHPGQRWGASISLPPMKRQDAEYWVAFLLSLKGQAGTFLLGDPNCFNAQGSATAKRNLLVYSEHFENVIWSKTDLLAVTGNTEAAPDGSVTAEKIVPSATLTGQHHISQTKAVVFGETYTASVYLRAGGYSWARLSLSNQFTSNYVYLNTSTGAIGLNSGLSNIQVVNAGGGWWRLSARATATASGNTNFLVYSLVANDFVAFSGDGTSGTIVWGAQLEVGLAPTAYQAVYDAYGPFVNGASQTGDTLVIDGCSPSVTGFLMPGDYIQLGAASSATLHKVLTQVDTDSVGGATLDLWPSIRTAPADNADVVVANTKGLFRLKENITQWQINDISSYGITFDCVEAI